ncbi:hypothetical protein MAR_029499, partial [Mya arenaria]
MRLPLMTTRQPLVSEATPCDSEANPCDSEVTPCDSEANPCDSEVTPCDSEANPCDSENSVKIVLKFVRLGTCQHLCDLHLPQSVDNDKISIITKYRDIPAAVSVSTASPLYDIGDARCTLTPLILPSCSATTCPSDVITPMLQ